jgi:hypothetical protein
VCAALRARQAILLPTWPSARSAPVHAAEAIKAFRRAKPRLIALLNSIHGPSDLGVRSGPERRSLEGMWRREFRRGTTWRVERGGAGAKLGMIDRAPGWQKGTRRSTV